MIRHYSSIALVDLSYLFTRNYRGAGVNAPPNAGAERTIADIKAIRDDVDHVIVCLDTAPYLRRDKYPAYKAQRETPPPEELNQKRAVIAELRRLGFPIARHRGYEADDVIATLAAAYGEWCPEVRMVASDKDIAQCITQNVIQYIPSHGARDAERRDHLKCKVKFGVYPPQMPLWQALVGDSSDNVPGIRNIGEKKATYVITQITAAGQPATLQGLAQFLTTSKRTGKEWEAITAGWETLRQSLELVTLDRSVPLDVEALLSKPEPEVDAEAEMGVPGFEGNDTPASSQPAADALSLDELIADQRAQRVAEDDAERDRRHAAPIIGADPRAAEILREKAAERAPAWGEAGWAPQNNPDRATLQSHQALHRIADGLVDATGRQSPEGPRKALTPHDEAVLAHERAMAAAAGTAANDPAGASPPAPAPAAGPQGRPAITEAEFDPIGKSPGASGPLPPLPPKEDPKPAPAVAAAPPPVAADPSTALAKPQPASEWGITNTKLQPQDLTAAWKLAQAFHKAGMYGKFETPHAVFAIIHRGVELGLDIGSALQGIHSIDGKPSLSADLIRALAKRHPDCEYFYCEHSDDQRATWVTRNRRHPPGVVQRYTYTIEEARQVPHLWKKDRWGGPSMWEKYPKPMLSKTCSSMLARQEWESAALGFYCPEEMSNGVIETVGVAA